MSASEPASLSLVTRHPSPKRYVKWCKKPGITPYKDVCDKKTYCDRRPGARQVCQKMQVLHVNEMSRSAGVLVLTDLDSLTSSERLTAP